MSTQTLHAIAMASSHQAAKGFFAELQNLSLELGGGGKLLVGISDLLPLQTSGTTLDLTAGVTAAGADADSAQQVEGFRRKTDPRQ